MFETSGTVGLGGRLDYKKEGVEMLDITSALHSMNASKEAGVIGKVGSGNQEDRVLRRQTDNFEAIFIKALLDSALNLDVSMYPKQPGKDIYDSMYKESIAGAISGGFGYSELLFNYLKDQRGQ